MAGWRADRVGAALSGSNPTVLTRMAAGFAVIGDVQFLPGYCVLITDAVGVGALTDLPAQARRGFLHSMDLLGEAVTNVCGRRDSSFRRVNMEILGNRDEFLHAHVWPRYDWEPPEAVHKPVWLYPPSHWTNPEFALGDRHDAVRSDLIAELARLS